MEGREIFQSTLPAWGETSVMARTNSAKQFQSTLPAWGETSYDRQYIPSPYFNPLSPHGERPSDTLLDDESLQFQSTLPAWGETDGGDAHGGGGGDFNPLSPHGERRAEPERPAEEPEDFNPLSPHGERRDEPEEGGDGDGFQSTLPAWGETSANINTNPRTEFQSTLPAWGETWIRHGRRWKPSGFQSTLPAWGETWPTAWVRPPAKISIHSPRMGRDEWPGEGCRPRPYFNPLSPHGERQNH